ncbi:Hypothetical protein AJAP_42710 (plasmid) [Amycolatopsis japonica]|uniref:Uncharacterized protein n=1 Tax=Amycolatopsis japonica TaxID=208439 RepID=A0A075V9V2_9PSEU|nr:MULTISPECIES: hypothetical protein [Amycolatopsis]AIG81309.1 Hypothetical protein AJAP_42710 [Amycolatopsis japonica]RSN38620.1 hypothetical protein DMC64_41885 [Amycolatopsis sp. WAC 04197]
MSKNQSIDEIRRQIARRAQTDAELTALLTPHGFTRHANEHADDILYVQDDTNTYLSMGTFDVYLSFFAPTGRGDDGRMIALGHVHQDMHDNAADTYAYVAITLHEAAAQRRLNELAEPR